MRPNLRIRLFLGMLVVAITVAAGFAFAMHEFVEVLEDELLTQTLRRELDSLVADYRQNELIEGQRGASEYVYLVKPGGDEGHLPSALRRLEANQQREVVIEGREVYAARRDVDGGHLYFVLEVEPVERLETRLMSIGAITLLAAVFVSVLIALLFSFVILRPVRMLALHLSKFDPAHPSRPIAEAYNDREMRIIAESFDGLITRFQDFIDRERNFTEDASHELRTPLAVALSANELLLEQSDLSTQTRERAGRVRDACVRMQRLVSALLFLARDRVEYGESCDAAVILNDVVSYYASAIDRKAIQLTVDARPVRIAAPMGVMDCVLHNLLENAVAHTDTGTIEIRLDAQKLVVQDSGQGIAPNALEHIFERRYRSANSRGFGIGLYLVKRICTRLGWRISVASDVDHGTRFEIWIG